MVLLHAEQLNQMAYGRHRCKICLLDHKTSTTHYYEPNYRGRTNLKTESKANKSHILVSQYSIIIFAIANSRH